MNDLNNDSLGLMVKERSLSGTIPDRSVDGPRAMIAVKDLAISKQISEEQRAEEEKFLAGTEAEIAHRYQGIRGYLRLFEVTRVIATLSLYLYLDQFDVHQVAQNKHLEERLKRAHRLTRMAVYGEKLYGIRIWFFQKFVVLLRRLILGSE